MISMDLRLHHGQKVKIKNKHFENRTGSIDKFEWITQNYIVVMDNGNALPFKPSEIEVIEGEKNSEILKLSEWIETDGDSCQHVRKINDDTFSLIEMGMINPETNRYKVYTDTICLSDYPEDEITDIINVYGHLSIEDVMKIYGVDGNQIIAECIFEQYSSFDAESIFRGTEDDAIQFILSYIESN